MHFDYAISSLRHWSGKLRSRSHHLARALADLGNDVLFIEPTIGNHTAPTQNEPPQIQPTDIARVKRLTLKGSVRSNLSDKATGEVVSRVISDTSNYSLLREIQVNTAVITYPLFLPIIESLRPNAIVFDVIDDFIGYFSHLRRSTLDCISASRVITCVSPSMLSRDCLLRRDRPIRLLPNGVWPQQLPPPSAGNGAVYFGVINQRIDLDLLHSTLKQNPDLPVALIGPVQLDLRSLRHYANLTVHGAIPFDQAIKRLSEFRVGLIPFLINDITTSCHPMKALEYMAAGLDVVSTNLPSLQELSEIVYLVDDPNNFASTVQLSLSTSRSPQTSARVAKVLQDHSWHAVAGHLMKICQDD